MKRNATFSIQRETPGNLRALAKQLDIVHTRGVGALGRIGSASGLLDYISYLVQTKGLSTVAEMMAQAAKTREDTNV